ncbi:MAG: penicillin-binding transpeptidase domain-containing protein [Eubacteriaceae bacterium]|nr:penicillin-binding transpeptidase domain-containing protein [Eubacteriaceae bacterium]
MLTKFRQMSVKRIVAAFVLIMFFFSILAVRLVYVQVFSASDLSVKQEELMTKKISLTATRGDILDRNKNILASDASCSMISVYPNDIVSGNDANVSTYLASELGISYDSVYNKVSNKKMNNLVIKRGVDNATALRIRQAHIPGVVITEDKKRYYTDSSSAQFILGFVGVEHTGRYGIEAIYESALRGTDGSQTFLTDSTGRKIESGQSSQPKRVESIPGDSLILSIDRNIQYFTEKAVYEAWLRNGPKRVIAIVSDPNTGELLAMAAYPAFDLESAWDLDSDFQKSFSSELDGMSLSEQQLQMWKNPFTSLLYEPGSTFKMFTVSSALEAGSVNMNSSFYCPGSYRVDSITYKCHIFPRGHGSERLTDTVVNSCNPAMIQIATRMGPETFYKYIKDYGFGSKTGVSLDGEEVGILYERTKPVDFVTLGFGQGIAVTPIQMIMAANAVINGGKLYEPILVDTIVNSGTKQAVEKNKPTVAKQVISASTSEQMREILYQAASNSSGMAPYNKEKGLKIGGKTGTAQKVINGAYSHSAVVANFYGFAPYDDPKYSVLVLVDEPTGSYTMGSTAAAPIAGQILESILAAQGGNGETKPAAAVSALVPDLRGKPTEQAVAILDAMDIPYEFSGGAADAYSIVMSQTNINEPYSEGMVIYMSVSDSVGNSVGLPSLRGMTVSQANAVLTSIGLQLKAEGGGIAVSQSDPAGTVLEKGSVVTVVFNYVE